jgi:hypothetical protein
MPERWRIPADKRNKSAPSFGGAMGAAVLGK